jgi:hypothetical protein
MRRLLRTALLTAVAAATLPMAAASATPPIRDRSVGSFDDSLPAEVCGFPIDAHIEQRVTMKIFVDDEGLPTGGKATGSVVVTLTNGDTGDRAELNIPGPTFLDANLDLVRGAGPWATFLPDGRFVVATGRTTFEDGVAVDTTGHVIDVCALLSPAA